MDCVNHIGVPATAYCQNCGQALCSKCARTALAGQVLCEPCWMSWKTYQMPFGVPSPSGPNPAAAAVLGLIPGVGAMYNGQFVKGFIHVAVFAVLVTGASEFHGPIDTIFGLFIPAWILYQSFEAYHTAKALRDGQPLPDPFGLNGAGEWLNQGAQPRNPGQPGAAGEATQSPEPNAEQQYAGYQPYSQAPFTAPPPPPPPPVYWPQHAPMGAIVLIALGTLFLLGQLDIFQGRLLEYSWPIMLIALGVWLIVRNLEDSRRGSK